MLNAMRKIAETYGRHPMGRSLSPIALAVTTGGDEKAGRPLFEAQGLEYSIERRDGRVWHQETRRDSSGQIIARNEAEVQFVLGSGSQGIGYLIERDGFLFQSPISWYVRKQQWDLAPGYEQMNAHFDRPVASTCLYCHANRVEPVAGTINRYRPPIFQGHAIGCERCHGPGELHVRRPDHRRWPGHDDCQPCRAGALAPGRGLRAMPLDGPSPRCEARSSGGGLSARAAVR